MTRGLLLGLSIVAFAAASAAGQLVTRRPVLGFSSIPAAQCPAAHDGAYDATVVVPTVAPGARVAIVTVCFAASPSVPAIARYDASIAFPASMAVFDSAAQSNVATQTLNTATRGLIRFTGSNVRGVDNGVQLVIRLRLLRPGDTPPITLQLADARALSGASILRDIWIQDRPPVRNAARLGGGGGTTPTPGDMPYIASLDRSSAANRTLANGQPVSVTIRGARFDPTNNTVMFGPIAITNVRSRSGTQITFTVPTMVQPRDGGQAVMLQPADYSVTVQTIRGSSNAVPFRITP